MNAISRREANPAGRAATGRVSTASFQAEQRWLEQLRQLSPPASTGVTVSMWRKAIDLQLRDTRAAVVLYGKEFAKVVRSWKRPPPTAKLPQGTGPTAAILAQAFNSPEGRRFISLQNKLFKQMQTDGPDWERMLKAVGLLKTCSEAGTAQAPGTATVLTTTTRP